MTRTVWKPQGVEDTNFLYMDKTISKRGITLEPLCRTTQNKCHAHLFFIDIRYIDFHMDGFTSLRPNPLARRPGQVVFGSGE